MSPTPLPIATRAFRLTLWDYVRIASRQYWSRWWFAMAAYPVFGVVALFVLHDPLGRGLGVVALLWPLTVPLRAAMLALRTVRRFGAEVTPHIYQDFVAFEGSGGRSPGYKLRFDAIRDADCTSEAFLLYVKGYSYAILPVASFPDESSRAAFERHLRGRVSIVRPRAA